MENKLEWVRINRIGGYEGEEVELRGWVQNLRSSGKIQFLQVRDGSGTIQAVAVKQDLGEELFSLLKTVTIESSVIVKGFVRKEERAPSGYELTLTNLDLIHLAEEYPIGKKEHGVDFLMDHRHLWLRSPRQQAIIRIRSEIVKAIRDFLDDHDFILVDSPILTPSSCEGTTNLFKTDYFNTPAYLSQSGQLYGEVAAHAFGKIYSFGPTFRAEKSKTRRHLTEFWMVEPEMAFYDFEDNMKVQEEMVSYLVQRVIDRKNKELKLLERDLGKLEKVLPPFPRISYDDALIILKNHGEDVPWGEDFGGGHETIIASQFDRPVFVHRFPAVCKAFYMKPDPERPEVVLGADLLAPEGYGEIIGGAQRIDDLELLRKRIAEHNLPEDDYQWYLDLRRYGSVPHSGFGLGIERTVAWICGLEHVRETIPFPRLLNRLYP